MANITISGTFLGTALTQVLNCNDLQPGSEPSYQACKTILSYHPLGWKMAGGPIKMAQSQKRDIAVPDGPEDRLKEAFEKEWKAVGADQNIRNTATLSRAYGVATMALINIDQAPNDPIEFTKLAGADIGINILDPLNISGSAATNQNPNAIDFQKVDAITVQGQGYHRSRTVTLLNEEPIYIQWTTSAFGYVGRSVYQRAFYMLKSYLQTLITDDMITLKAGVIIAKMAQTGSVIDQISAAVAGVKRNIVNEAQIGNTISISTDEEIETLNFQNLDGPYSLARKNILENIATAADMPAIILNQETFAEGFGEGTEDAEKVKSYIESVREWMQPLYDYMDKVVMYRAWNKEFYKTIQVEFPDQYKGVPYTVAFTKWKNSFTATWPNPRQEPDSEKIKVDDVKLKAMIAIVEVVAPMLPGPMKAELIAWLMENINEMKLLFSSPLILDIDQIAEYTPEEGEESEEPSEPKPFAASDSAKLHRALDSLKESVTQLPERRRRNIKKLVNAA